MVSSYLVPGFRMIKAEEWEAEVKERMSISELVSLQTKGMLSPFLSLKNSLGRGSLSLARKVAFFFEDIETSQHKEN